MIFQKYIKSIVLIIIVVFVNLGYSQNPPHLIIKGNNKTKNKYINNIFIKCTQDYPLNEDSNTSKVEQCIMNTKLFESVHLYKEEQTQDSWILEVKEKWTLLALPLFKTYSDNQTQLGFVGYERNFLGEGKLIFTRLMFGSKNSNFSIFYIDPNVLYFPINLSIFITHNNILNEFKPTSDNLIDAFYENSNILSVSAGYKFSKITYNLGISIAESKLKEYKDFNVDNSSIKSTKTYFGINFKNQNYKLFFDEGYACNLQITKDIYNNIYKKYPILFNINLNYQKNLLFNNAIQLSIFTETIFNPNKEQTIKTGAKKGLRGIAPQSIWIQKIYAASIDYQIPFYTTRYGVYTIAPFVDNGYIQFYHPSIKINDIQYTSFGIGTYLYLKQIAVPGIGLELGSNNKFLKKYFTFALGSMW